jgi:hypothetical protein
MAIRSFSGRHEFQRTCLSKTDANEPGTVDQIVADINSGRCPRCRGPLPNPPEFPAGSRVTRCRCIPICGGCGSDEAHEEADGLGLSPVVRPAIYPLPPYRTELEDSILQKLPRNVLPERAAEIIGKIGADNPIH